MTPDEIATLQSIGTDWITSFIAIINETVFLTVYAFLVVRVALVLLERRAVRAYVLLMLAILTMFCITVVLWALDLTSFILEPKMALIQHPEEPIDTKLNNAFSLIFKIVSVQDVLYAYSALMGDAIIIHRAWMLKAYYHTWIFAIPCALLLVFSVSTATLTYCVAVVGSEIVLGNFEKPAVCKNVQEVGYIMPMCTTAVTTILIGITAWKHQKRVDPLHSNGSGYGRRRTHVEKILILLVESGFFYFIFFLIQVVKPILVVNNWIDSNTTLIVLTRIFDDCSSVFVGIYPVMIIVLAHDKRGIIDEVASVTAFQAAQVTRGVEKTLNSAAWKTLSV
ncbi:hypothetical protein GGX14DRAFT_701546 [Mycena pura]|uniref:Uncharacterized protein n=1 Tax=Mycena pura TaxID=153505 RepID=A0AAD6UQP3_9AGAR|nr:hypothetical protein GGX14DRAFT_701546 [Mycena pura]